MNMSDPATLYFVKHILKSYFQILSIVIKGPNKF